jgi:hypothetical protein
MAKKQKRGRKPQPAQQGKGLPQTQFDALLDALEKDFAAAVSRAKGVLMRAIWKYSDRLVKCSDVQRDIVVRRLSKRMYGGWVKDIVRKAILIGEGKMTQSASLVEVTARVWENAPEKARTVINTNAPAIIRTIEGMRPMKPSDMDGRQVARLIKAARDEERRAGAKPKAQKPAPRLYYQLVGWSVEEGTRAIIAEFSLGKLSFKGRLSSGDLLAMSTAATARRKSS